MGSGGKSAAGQVASAGIYTGGRITTNALTIAQAFAVAMAQIGFLKWAIKKQTAQWDHVANKQISTVNYALNQYNNAVEGLMPSFSAAYPEVPEAVPYVAVDLTEQQAAAIAANRQNSTEIGAMTRVANYWTYLEGRARAEFLSPGFANLFDGFMRDLEQFREGRLPSDEVVQVLTDTAEQAALTGSIGAPRLAAANLGIRQLQLKTYARGEMTRHLAWLESMAPTGASVRFSDLMQRPDARAAFVAQQNQLIQNSLQNLANTAAQKSPALMAALQTRLQMANSALAFNANKANMQNQFVPNYAGLFSGVVNNLTGSLQQSMGWERNPDSGQDLGGHLTPSSVTTVA